MYSDRHTWVSPVFDLDTAADKVYWSPMIRSVVHRVGVVPLAADAGGGTIAFDKANAGARGAGDVGIVVLPASDQEFNTFYTDAAAGGVVVEAGEVVIVEVTAEGGTGPNCLAKIEYSLADDKAANDAGMIESA